MKTAAAPAGSACGSMASVGVWPAGGVPPASQSTSWRGRERAMRSAAAAAGSVVLMGTATPPANHTPIMAMKKVS